jgi:hypothetical protein
MSYAAGDQIPVRVIKFFLRAQVAVNGLVVMVLAIEPKSRRFTPDPGRWFLSVIRIRSTTSFGGQVKPSVPHRKILQHVKKRYEYEGDTS